MTPAPWKKLSSRTLLDLSPWFSVIEDTVLLPSGRTADNYYRIEAPDSVLIQAVLPDGKVLMERQYKQCLAQGYPDASCRFGGGGGDAATGSTA